jgi:hypothetical protein
MVLRVYLFALPGACVLAAYAFFPVSRSTRHSWRGHLAAGVCALTLVGAFLFARYGNEAYEMTRLGELAAVEYVYQHGGSPVLFMTDNDDPGATPFIPLGYQDMDDIQWASIRAPTNPRDVNTVVAALRKLSPDGYLLATRSQERYLNSVADYPMGWGDEFRSHMRKVPQVRVVAENADAVVYALRTGARQGVPVLRSGQATGVRVEQTPWSGVGAFLLVPLLVALLIREVLRIRLGPGWQARLLPLTVLSAPLLIAFVAVLIERLIVLTTIAPGTGSPDSACDVISIQTVQLGRGGTPDLLQLQRPLGWCLLQNPFISVWSENSPIGGMTG